MSMGAGGLAVALFMQLRAVDKKVLLPPIVSLKDMGHLVSLKVNYLDVIEFDDPTSINLPFDREIPLGTTLILLVAKGDYTLATDLRNSSYKNVDQQKRTVT